MPWIPPKDTPNRDGSALLTDLTIHSKNHAAPVVDSIMAH